MSTNGNNKRVHLILDKGTLYQVLLWKGGIVFCDEAKLKARLQQSLA